MALISFDFDTRLTEEFLRCGHERNCRDPRFILPLRADVASQFRPDFPFHAEPGNRHRHFLLRSGGRAIGRVSAFVNGALHDADGTPLGALGFYECIDDAQPSAELLAAATEWLRAQGLRRVWGPMNFDIWHGYRFITRGADSEPFVGEPRNPAWYPAQFERFGFRAAHEWVSLLLRGRDNLRNAAEALAPYRLRCERDGFRFRELNLQAPREDFRLLYRLLLPAFADFPGITPHPEEEFVELLMRNSDAFAPGLILFFEDPVHGALGFSATFLDRARAVRALRGSTAPAARLRYLLRRGTPRRAIYLLGGLHPAHARRCAGSGRALVSLTLERVLERGMDEVLVALMRKGNKARGLFRDARADEEREYTLYGMDL